ncbi:MAG: hypothetical protein FD167_346 [bacterium]|nr:MAG: hypothetical protein FD167_346 [bacterium]
MAIKVILGGPPQSGKTCLKEGLKYAINQINSQYSSLYPYIITACPDGEFAGFQLAFANNPELAREMKQSYKTIFTEGFVKTRAEWVKNVDLPLTIIDIGGKVSPENEQICQYATHAILLAGNLNLLPEWDAFCQKLRLKIIAKLHSDYHAKEDKLLEKLSDFIYYGSIHHLDRSDLSVRDRPTIKALANILLEMAIAQTQ